MGGAAKAKPPVATVARIRAARGRFNLTVGTSYKMKVQGRTREVHRASRLSFTHATSLQRSSALGLSELLTGLHPGVSHRTTQTRLINKTLIDPKLHKRIMRSPLNLEV